MTGREAMAAFHARFEERLCAEFYGTHLNEQPIKGIVIQLLSIVNETARQAIAEEPITPSAGDPNS